MSASQATRKTLRAAIAFALTYLMVWGGMPAPALAEMAEEAMGEEPVAAPATSRGDANGKTSSPASTGQADAATTGGGEGELGTDVAPAAPVEGEPGSTPAAEAPTNTDGELGVQSGDIPGDSETEAAAATGATVSTQSDIAASGTWGTCPWELDVDGALTIYPGNAGTDKPWSDFTQYITSVRMVEQDGRKVVLLRNCNVITCTS